MNGAAMRMAFLPLLLVCSALGQVAPAFEVASIKPAAPPDTAKIMAAAQAGGPMPIGPHIGAHGAEYLYMSLKSLIAYAYQVKPYQVSGPDWLDQDRFDILAKYPAESTKADAPQMLQSLLKERFQLRVHKSAEERRVLGLVVGNGGLKLKASTGKQEPIDNDATLPPGVRKVDGPDGQPMLVRTDLASGSLIVDLGEQGRMTYRVDRSATPPTIHVELSMVTMRGFAAFTTQILTQIGGAGGRQIVDMTQVAGNYEVSFDLSLDDMLAMARSAGLDLSGDSGAAAGGSEDASAPGALDPGGAISLNEAVRRMGLKLESRKAPVELLVADYAERKPSGN